MSLLNFGAMVVTHLAFYIEIFRMLITVFENKVLLLFLVTCTLTLVCVVFFFFFFNHITLVVLERVDQPVFHHI